MKVFFGHLAAGDDFFVQGDELESAEHVTALIEWGVVTFDEAAPLPHHDMLVNLTRRTPANLAQFARVFEIISLDEDDAAAGRQRYAAYKKQSYPLTHFVAGKS